MRAFFTNEAKILLDGLAPESRFLQLAHLEGLSSLALVGLSKNAGKTTCLNHLIRAWQQAGNPRPLALTSIGRDGEDEDVVSGQPKPRIYIYSGTYLATAKSSLERSDALLDILALSGIRTNFGEIVICKALSNGYVELAGPSQAADLRECERLLRLQDPNVFYIIDGALSRRAQAGGGLTEALIMAVGAETSVIPEELAEITTHALSLFNVRALESSLSERIKILFDREPGVRVFALLQKEDIPAKTLSLPSLVGQAKAISSLLDGEVSTLVLRGALTDTICKSLLAEKHFQNLKLVVEDGTRLFISAAVLRKLNQKEVYLAALYPLSVQMICVNPFKADGTPADGVALLKALRKATKLPVEDFGPALV